MSTRLNPVLLKWAAVPLLTFVLAGFVTKRLVESTGVSPAAKLLHAKREAEGKPFQQSVDASLRRLDSGDRAGAVEGLARAGKAAPDESTGQVSSIPKFLALGEYKLAAEAIERFLRSEPNARQMARSYASLCEFLLEHGDLNNAKRILTSDLLAREARCLGNRLCSGRSGYQGSRGEG
jgi:predicted Zn-dependent protease